MRNVPFRKDFQSFAPAFGGFARLAGKALSLALLPAFAILFSAQTAKAQYAPLNPFDDEMRAWFGYQYWDLPQFGDYHYLIEQEEYRHDSIISTGFDPAFGCYGLEAEVPNFGQLTVINNNTLVAYNVLVRTTGSADAAADEYASWTPNDQAVYLNTMAAIAAQGIPTDQLRFEGFYHQTNGIAGVTLSGVTNLGSMVQAGESWRSPSYTAVGSLEATPLAGSPGTFEFDVDIWNPISPAAPLHLIEWGMNHAGNDVTHPIDAANALAFRGVHSGIDPRCKTTP